MDCRAARRSHFERELGLGSSAARAELDRHLAACSGCRASVARERGLTADLAALRVDPPFDIDAGARVAARVAALRPAAPLGLDRHELAWLLPAAAAFASILVCGAWQALPAPAALASEASILLSAAAQAVSGLLAPLAVLFDSGARSLGGLAGAARSVAEASRALEPVATATIASCTLMMAASIGLVLGRDLMRPCAAEGDETR